jgi:hypothetical protein
MLFNVHLAAVTYTGFVDEDSCCCPWMCLMLEDEFQGKFTSWRGKVVWAEPGSHFGMA